MAVCPAAPSRRSVPLLSGRAADPAPRRRRDGRPARRAAARSAALSWARVRIPAAASRSSRAASTAAVARASARARWRGRAGAPKKSARVASLQFGTSSSVSSSRASVTVSSTGGAGQRRPVPAHAAVRKPTSKGALCAVSTAPAGEVEEAGQDRADRGGEGDHGVGDAGQGDDVGRDQPARVDQGGELAADLAAAQPDRADLGDAVRVRRPSRGLHVHHDEVQRPERPPPDSGGPRVAQARPGGRGQLLTDPSSMITLSR